MNYLYTLSVSVNVVERNTFRFKRVENYNHKLSFPRDPIEEIAESLAFYSGTNYFCEDDVRIYSKKIDQ